MLEEALARMEALSTPVASVVAPPLSGSASVNIEDASDRQGAAIAGPHMEVINQCSTHCNCHALGGARGGHSGCMTPLFPIYSSSVSAHTKGIVQGEVLQRMLLSGVVVKGDASDGTTWVTLLASSWEQSVEHVLGISVANSGAGRVSAGAAIAKNMPVEGEVDPVVSTLLVLERVTSFWTFMREVDQVGG